MRQEKPIVLMLGPSREALSGVSTHLNLLFGSSLGRDFALRHFQVGSEGRGEAAPARLLRLLASPFALAMRILLSGAAIVHLNTSLNARAYWRDLVYLVVAKLCGARVIYQVHGGALPRQFCAGNVVLEALLRATLMWPETVVVLAQSEFEAYRDFLPEQVILVFPNGIDLAPYAGLARVPAEAPASLRLLYVGRLARDKGLGEALHGLAIACQKGVAATLVIAGGGPDEAALRAMAQRLGIETCVRFVGPVFDRDKLALYARADVLLLPTYAEGLPYTLLESMAAGVPAITTRVGGIPDVVADGVHGLFVPPRDAPAIGRAIARLADDRALLANMSQACQRRIANCYSIERLADAFHRLYWEICNGRRAGSFGKS